MANGNEKQEIQELSYNQPYHWKLKRIEKYRYIRVTDLLAKTIRQNISSHGTVRIIDFGCGDGRGTYLLWKKLKKDGLMPIIVGCDISERAIKWARSQLGAANGNTLQFIEGGIDEALNKVENDERSPLILIMREVMEHLSEEEIAYVLNVTRRRFSDNNWLLVTVPSTNSPVEDKHFRHYNLELLNTTLVKYEFKPIFFYGFGFRPRRAYKILVFAKSIFSRVPFLWRLMIPFWRVVKLKNAVTLICLA